LVGEPESGLGPKIESVKFSSLSMEPAPAVTMSGYAVRMTVAYNTLPTVLEKWSDICDQIVVYEHPVPPASRQHCHLLIVNPKMTSKAFKERSGFAKAGNSFWSWKNLKPGTRESALMYIRYMTKGKYDPKFMDGSIRHFSAEDLSIQKNLWIQMNPSRQHVITRSKSHIAYLEWVELWGNDPRYKMVCDALAIPDSNDTHAIYIEMIKRHAEAWLVAQNEGFYNQQVANQKINLVRSFLFQIYYRP